MNFELAHYRLGTLIDMKPSTKLFATQTCFERGFPVLLALFLLLRCIPGMAQVEASEYEVKAAFLFQFANYVEWPAETFNDPESPLVFGILDADDLAENLEQMVADRTFRGREILVRRLQTSTPLDGIHVLFVGRAGGAGGESILLDASSMSVLTVTETPPHPSGSVINFEIVDNRVRFDIALMPAAQGNLRISSRLLQVAQRVTN